MRKKWRSVLDAVYVLLYSKLFRCECDVPYVVLGVVPGHEDDRFVSKKLIKLMAIMKVMAKCADCSSRQVEHDMIELRLKAAADARGLVIPAMRRALKRVPGIFRCSGGFRKAGLSALRLMAAPPLHGGALGGAAF